MRRDMGRAGFTLVELLVVIAIIAVMIAILVPAVFKFVGMGPEAAARHEISQLSAAIGAFKTEFGVKTMPSRFVLHETLANYDPSVSPQPAWVTAQDLARSRQFLSQMFGRRLGATIDWDGDGTIQTAASQGKLLSGEQCLVFFLGGMRVTGPNGCIGFAANPTNPAAPGGERRGPFYEFKSARLVPDTALEITPVYPVMTSPTAPIRNGFFVYLDAFTSRNSKRPYVYFADPGTNAYNSGARDATNSSVVIPSYTGDSFEVVGTFLGDPAASKACTFLNPFRAGQRYINTGGFQIICAGPDGTFGDNAQYAPTTGTIDPNGINNFANFSRVRLAAPQE